MRRKLLGSMSVLVLLALGGWRIYGQDSQQPAPTYVGAAACICHADPIQKTWKTHKHAGAYELLKLVGQEKNEKCLPCHTTGYGRGGFGQADPKIDLGGVQCEECHGPGSLHASTADKTKITRTPSAAVCARCHQEMSIHALP
jgi:predicted CXXCH cytochrome family protein